ncbi:MAG: hypothetical protein ACK5LT_09050 [Lachnospirales bacterium]
MFKFNKSISLLLSFLVLSSFSFTNAVFADVKQDITTKDIMELEKFVNVNEFGELYLEMDFISNVFANQDAVRILKDHFIDINERVRSGEIFIDNNLNIKGENIAIITHRCFKGTNKVSTYWWGYRRYACNCESKRITFDLDSIAGGATISAGIGGGIAVIFPVSAPIAGAIGAGFTISSGYASLLSTRISANNKNYGTIINMTKAFVFDVEPQYGNVEYAR